MALISDGEWENIYDSIQYGLTHYGDNVSELIKIYKQIKVVLDSHGINKDNILATTGVRQYPAIINSALEELENKIKELSNTKLSYENIFSDIADSIEAKGVNISDEDPYEIYPTKILTIGAGITTVDGLGDFNNEGYLANDVVIPNGITVLGKNVIYKPELVKSLKLPANLTSFHNEACYNNGQGLINVNSLEFPINCTKISDNCFNSFGSNNTPAQIIINSQNEFDMNYDGANGCFQNSGISTIVFNSLKSDGYTLKIGANTFASSSQDLSITLPLVTTIYLKANAFPFGKNLIWNTENIVKIILNNGDFRGMQMSNEVVENLIKMLDLENSVIGEGLFESNQLLEDMIFDKELPLTSKMFWNCNNIKTMTIDLSKLQGKYFISTALGANTWPKFINVDETEDESIFYNSEYSGESWNKNSQASILDELLESFTTITPFLENVVASGYHDNRFVNDDLGSLVMNSQYFSWCYGSNMIGRGYGLWSTKRGGEADSLTTDEIYNVIKKFKKDSNFLGILNGLPAKYEELKLPYSSSTFWCGRDEFNTITGYIKTITFDTTGYDNLMDREGTCPFIFSYGFNNLQKVIWKKTGENSVISSQTFGARATVWQSTMIGAFPEKLLQNLKEIYFGEGATEIRSYLFGCIFYRASNSSYNNQALTQYNSSFNLQTFDYPFLKTIYLPGTLVIAANNAFIVTGEDGSQKGDFYRYPLYCGYGRTGYLNNLNQVLLGPGWSLPIELTSYCFKNTDGSNYYNVALTPEAMIFNINNLKDLSGEEYSKDFVVTNKTLYDLKTYCNEYAGQEKAILLDTYIQTKYKEENGTEEDFKVVIPAYDELMKLAEDKNWRIRTVPYTGWTEPTEEEGGEG